MKVTEVDQMIEAYQGTLAATAGLDRIEYAILVAAVLDNARAYQHRMVVARPGGDTQVARLKEYIAELEHDDKLGHAFAWAKKKAMHSGEAIATELFKWVFLTSTPALILSALGIFATVSGGLHDAGVAVGSLAGVTFLGLGAFAFAHPGLFGQMASRAAPAIGSSVSSGLSSTSESWAKLTSHASVVGHASQKVLDSHLRPVATSVQGAAVGTAGFQWPTKTRGTFQAILYSTAAIVAVASVIFGLGVIDGIDAATKPSQPCPNSVSVSC